MIKSKTIDSNVIVNTFKREFKYKTYICKQCVILNTYIWRILNYIMIYIIKQSRHRYLIVV